MLVLRRKVNQSIVIGDNIRVVVVAVEGDHVKIGVQAPRDISVHRSELVDGGDDAKSGSMTDRASRSRPAGQNEKD